MEPVPSITTAGKSSADVQDGRMLQYLITMLIRIVCLALAVFIDGWLRWVFAAGAIFLPYFAVVLASAGGKRGSRDDSAQLLGPPELTSGYEREFLPGNTETKHTTETKQGQP